MMAVMRKNWVRVQMLVIAFLLALVFQVKSQPPLQLRTRDDRCPRVKNGNPPKSVALSGVSYEPLDSNVLESELRKEIENAKTKRLYFYIGVAKANGTPIESLCQRQGSRKQTNADTCVDISTHHSDLKAATVGQKLDQVFYSNNHIITERVCALEMELIEDNFCDTCCRNEAKGRDTACIEGNEGIVYLRIYSAMSATGTGAWTIVDSSQALRNQCLRVKNGVPLTSVDVSKVSYEPLDSNVLESELRKEIKNAKTKRLYFYIGVAKSNGTPLESLCHRQNSNAPTHKNQVRCDGTSTHQSDLKAATVGQKLDQVFYSNKHIGKNKLCLLEMELIEDNFCDTCCRNEAKGRDTACIKGDKGIVYLRIYSPMWFVSRTSSPILSDINQINRYPYSE